jgi:hypothetical protein
VAPRYTHRIPFGRWRWRREIFVESFGRLRWRREMVANKWL